MNYNELTRPKYELNYFPLAEKLQKFNESHYEAMQSLNDTINQGIDIFNHNLIDKGKQKDTAKMIINAVCDYFETSLDAIIKNGRKSEFVKAKYIIIYFLRKYTHFSLMQIGKYFKNIHHTTVMYADNKVKDYIDIDKDYRNVIRDIQAMFIYV